MAISSFDYKAKSWAKSRTLHAIRLLIGYVEVENFGIIEKYLNIATFAIVLICLTQVLKSSMESMLKELKVKIG